ncbi:polyprenyl synthetase family protein [Heliophilum fasciatum]|uniref:Farnesyl diphosphate synthase n=1 Tax=Heliophilum fasciatum TaxID=35700 RepID=A0A4R2RWN6_9FIRM|nr:farnesyl diphosphate synthase [Heliophilum fasciatum]MCW2277340.1 geranylgeranyl diphosphate synthase type II [Heliophilum fasciatum]TCP67177.1 farnesyl-diphosphate synthase [Heliophilum fasciatum]
MNLKEEMKAMSQQVDAALAQWLPDSDVFPAVIHDAMRYSVFAGGKKLRPVLVLAACHAVGGVQEEVLPAAAALEMIHTYSLIHDDLPAMDDDDLRRGRPTNHKVYGEAVAVLAGDALLTRAFGVLAEAGMASARRDPARAALYLQVAQEVAEASGTLGMIGGQVVDMESEDKQIDMEIMEYIHRHKTGALIRVSLRVGALLGGGSAEQLAALTTYGEHLGLAFQITDDLLDIQGDEAKLGKPVGSDEKNQKSTYPSLLGIDGARQAAEQAMADALAALESFDEGAQVLRELARYLLVREN